MRTLLTLIPGLALVIGLAFIGFVVWINPSMIAGTFQVEGQPSDQVITVHTSRDWWPFAWDDQRQRPRLAIRAQGRLTGALWDKPLDTSIWSDGTQAPQEIWRSRQHIGLTRDADGRPMLRLGRCCVSTRALHPVRP